jgi:hypothetical protein
MGLLAEGFRPPPRSQLGCLDESLWEIDESSGRPRDPWQMTIYLPMVSVDAAKVYTFSTTSDGGRRHAVAPLCRAYGQRIRLHPDELPIVRLDQDSYQHSVKSYGRVKYPLLPIESWTAADKYLAAVATAAGRVPDDGVKDVA